MSELFLSYRRNDSPDVTGRLFDALANRFGHRRVFRDLNSTPYGVDYLTEISSALEDCKIMLAIIGHGWLGADAKTGARRIDEPHDYVKFEVSKALQLRKQVIPVIVSNASMPVAEDLPTELKPFSRINACQLRSDPDFWPDFNRLCERLSELGFNERRELEDTAYEAMQQILPAGESLPWDARIQPTIVDSDSLFEPNYDGLEIIRQIMIIDLRRWRVVPPDQMEEKFSPVTWTRYLLFKRKPQNPQDCVAFRFRTRGIDIDFRCRSPRKQHIAKRGRDRKSFVGVMMFAWEFIIDLTHIEPGHESELITDAIFWNTHQDKETWASCFVNAPMELDMWLLFPQSIVPTNIRLCRIAEGSDNRETLPLRHEHVEFGRNDSILHWQINQPRVGYIHNVSWLWPDGVVFP